MVFFGLQVDVPITGGGGAYKQKFTVCTPLYQYFIYTVCHISPDKGLCDFDGADL